jgi:ribonuclease R/exosome complex exonuclease DIS3/RRP44
MPRKKIYKKKGRVIKNLTQNVLSVFSKNPNKIYNYKQVCAKIDIVNADGRSQVIKKIAELTAQGKLEEVDRGKYILNETKNYHIGTLDLTSSGNAYFICDDFEKDVFIPSINVNRGLDKDTVKVYVYNKSRSSKKEGDVVEIIERAKTEFVGVLQLSKNFGFVVPDNNKMYSDIFISSDNLADAVDGDKVIATLTDWPERSKNPFGKITQVLGRPGEHNTEIHSILAEYGLPYEFPAHVEKEAEDLDTTITEEEIAKRRDMRGDLTFTVDPKDAKDFDDALSYKELENGNFEIGIHIADVSHYIDINSELEKEAYERATSVYLVDRVVPMLPEKLSNGVCSLRPHEEKLTFSAVFELGPKGGLINEWYGRTITYSDQRFAYEEAQVIIENGKRDEKITIPEDISIQDSSYEVSEPIVNAVLKMDELAKILRKKRLKAGAITFDRVEVKFDLDEEAKPLGVFFKESKDANKLIEEFMLLANKKVSEFVGKKGGRPSKNTFVYRVHDQPNVDKLTALQGIIGKFGYSIDIKSRQSTSETLNQLLADVHGKGESNMIETLAIRTMSKAEYTTDNIGHYGLAFDYYSHFTSPIRRYPDVMAHRLLQHYLDGGQTVNKEEFQEKCKHSSDMEYLATKAERDSIKYMQIKYMQDHQDQEFLGVISGVTEWGIYVEIIENKCEGMVRTRDIKDDYYIFDEKQYALVGQSTKNMYQLGDEVYVKVKNTDLDRKHLDFSLVEKK